MFESGHEYDNPEVIFDTIITNNYEIFNDNFNVVDNEISNDVNNLIISSSTIVNDIPTKVTNVVHDNNDSTGTEQYLEFLSKLDQESIPNQLGIYIAIINSTTLTLLVNY